MMPSPMQLLIVLVIFLVLFGGRRIGELGKGLGEGIRNFKRGLSDEDEKAQSKLSSKDGPDQTKQG